MAMQRIHTPSVAALSTPQLRKVEAPVKSDNAFAAHLQRAASSEQIAIRADTERESARHRTFGFSALGTLGIHAWTGGGTAQTGSTEYSQNTHPSGSASGSVSGANAVLPPEAGTGPLPEGSLTGTSGVPCPSALDLAPASVELPLLSQSIGGPNAVGNSTDPETVAEEAEAAPARRASMPDSRMAPSVSLTVSGTDEALVITARAADEEISDVKLQQGLEAVVADFDMQISELRLNGSPTHLSPIGKNAYGHSTR